jgi:hypothetical protein
MTCFVPPCILASVLEQIQVSNLNTKTQMIFFGLLILALFHGFVNICEHACYNTIEYGFASSSRTLAYDMREVSLVVSAILI